MRSAGDQHPQVAGDRLLEGEQLEERLLHPLAGRVDDGVVGDDLLGDLGVRGQQRLGRSGDGLLHLWVIVTSSSTIDVELVEVGITHAVNGRSPR